MKLPSIGPRSVAAVLALTLCVTACSSEGGPTNEAAPTGAIPDGAIKLGATLPLSGAMGSYGAPYKANYEAAAEYVNEVLGGIDGHQIDLIIENDQSDPATSASLAHGLIEQGVSAIVYPIYQRAGVLVTRAAPPEAFNDVEKYSLVFSHDADFDHMYSTSAEFVANSGIKKIGLLNDTLPVLEPVAKRLTEDFEANGVEVVSTQTVPFGATDFTTALRKLQNDGAQSIFALVTVGLSQMYDGLRSLNWTPKSINTMGTAWFDGMDAVGEFAEITFSDCFYGIPAGEELDPKLAEILEFFAERAEGSFPAQIAGALPALNSLLTYKYAVEQAETLEAEEVAVAIETFSNKEYLTPANVLDFSTREHVGWQKSSTCSLLPLGAGQTPYVATSVTDRQPIN